MIADLTVIFRWTDHSFALTGWGLFFVFAFIMAIWRDS